MYKSDTSIKYWAEEERPREKLQSKGKKALTNAECLAIILGSGTRKKSAVELAFEILSHYDNNLYLLGKSSQIDLMQFHGVGEAKAISVLAALELGRRRANEELPKVKKIETPKDIYNHIRYHFQDLDHEEFRVVGLSSSNKILGNKLISKGGISGTVADGRLIFKALLDMKAASGVFLHNHPSGNLKPSGEDINLTNRFKQFGDLINLKIMDHLIVADTGYYSFSEEGRM